MSRPRLLDLFCGAGGAAMGYHRAGFEVVGVDINPQRHFPFEFVQADALSEVALDLLSKADAVHASPPCQAFTTMSNRWRGAGGRADSHPDYIALTRNVLALTGKPYVIENVTGARSRMRSPILLHGGGFGLAVYRPRLFESNLFIYPHPKALPPKNPVGVYGKSPDGRRLFRRSDGSEQTAATSVEEARAAMGIHWMDWRELAEAIPPAYTEWIGRQLIAVIEKERAA